jgi:AraC-like DNA-binding protein
MAWQPDGVRGLEILRGLFRREFPRHYHEFTRSMGIPPHAYHLQRRIRAAQRHLAVGESVTDVAQQLGFSDQAHLTRLFKRLVGVTPGHYRSAHGHQTLRR